MGRLLDKIAKGKDDLTQIIFEAEKKIEEGKNDLDAIPIDSRQVRPAVRLRDEKTAGQKSELIQQISDIILDAIKL